jgi:hypothetical protein
MASRSCAWPWRGWGLFRDQGRNKRTRA